MAQRYSHCNGGMCVPRIHRNGQDSLHEQPEGQGRGRSAAGCRCIAKVVKGQGEAGSDSVGILESGEYELLSVQLRLGESRKHHLLSRSCSGLRRHECYVGSIGEQLASLAISGGNVGQLARGCRQSNLVQIAMARIWQMAR